METIASPLKSNKNPIQMYWCILNIKIAIFLSALQCNMYHNIVSILTSYGEGEV